ncbi:MAG: membrane protease subunit, stomatin/prohibitin [Ignavibacteria bacterium RIFOXYB2_FULL_35_12]|nr:MAG: membrane protease subunit, stomatin/prohibitin [Ignavibacteria bacterium GWA2_36_19]OGU50699.1 MAG: membrane protease subunit, stomatin/prohibitin [Ignavibacteria bacterium GWC2_35_8]OGU61838.1 MAG: membrane protease subunit, stomatin/prohibitin [Ignavibacteria bacterium GWF2_35_20]OGU82675.1 MAG: membrane protease subunit, stomatin/prohibitin [Ignavibacteria bacterium RIFOXYA2_FULL_35_9]OGU88250.1 MAG: membrane protease subunit, stomatin/prohibitin [Ignavibacteria bacterium RIFOXYA12_F
MLFIIAILAVVAASIVYFNAKRRANKQESSLALVALAVAAFIVLVQCWTIIPAGHTGVIDFLGNVSDETLKPGVNLVNPMANIEKMSIKTQEMRELMSVPSKEGLSVDLEISLLFRLNSEMANQIYKTVGPNYVDIILVPQFRSVVRGVTARYEAKALYTASREKLAEEILSELEKLVGPRGITVEQAPLRQIKLPDRLTKSIEEKLQAEQESQRMAFILLKEAQEADRKRIEAKGISDFQNIVAKGISDQLLKWKGIEATEKLANSPNTKVIVIGSGKDGLPLILGGN